MYLLDTDTLTHLQTGNPLVLARLLLLDRFPVVVLDDLAISHFERLNTIKGVSKIGRADLLIASIALAQDATLITRNIRHFGLIPNLTVVNWVD